MARDNLAEEWPPLRTVTDLALRFWNVRLSCQRCGHQRVLHGAALWKLFDRKGWRDDVQSAARRFHCAYCRKQDGSLVRPRLDKTKDPPTGAVLPLPSDAEWKKLTARYRS
ncbi:hypothetical protein OF829_08865 [Sphingomonas sp. LB-2]|uniref:hypothetical protein n=1 Tax=Sphingomonas caeni TaxID=2984949 RepID=UPI002230E00E|nr:hypothetical protein [Sphingomonas caeni]MCW3847351.1 hypothetical protein [Sphingomonas caeni]